MNYKKITLTFRNGNEITFEDGEWDDYRFLGNAVAIIKDKIWKAIYNFEDIFSVEVT